MILQPENMAPVDIYHALTQIIIPRPVAWLLTPDDDQASQFNLAPFSFFNVVCSDPPILMLSMGNKTSGEAKDSVRNLTHRQRGVVHIATDSQAQWVTDSAQEMAFGESEVERLGLELVDFEGTGLKRLATAPIALACRLYQHLEVGNKPQNLFLVEVEKVWIDDRVCFEDEKGRVRFDADRIKPLARLGGSEYASLDEVFRIDRR